MRCSAAVLGALMLWAAPLSAETPPAPRGEPLARKVIQNVARPGYERLAAATAALKTEAETFCAAPSAERKIALHAAFETALLAWSRVEMIRFGPVAQANRYDRFAFWPDEKGLGLKQIGVALAARDETAAAPETLRAKSVALQGFTALEFLLYGAGAEALSTTGEDGRFRCRFAAAIAANLAALAVEVRIAWEDDTGFADGLLNPKPEHPVYKSSRDVKLELFKTFITGLQHLRDVKLARVLADNPQNAQPKRAPYWRSGLTLKVMQANIEALETYFNRGGYFELLSKLAPGVEKSVALDLAEMRKNVQALGAAPVEMVVKSKDGWGRLNSVLFELVTVQQTGGGAIARASNISIGFNALDGD
ncbi:MAG: imelysin family protein [Hyphomicrobiales bacterium]|nr:imelysin family protein [Hyphomicrobiales bacterium]